MSTETVYDHVLKTGDLSPALGRTLLDDADEPVDLTGASVDFIMESLDGTTVIDTGATIDGDPTNGQVRYNWSDGDTDDPGTYRAEFEVDYGSGGSPETFPNTDYLYIRITDDLGGVAP